MEHEFWLQKWQSNDIAFHEENINPDLIAYLHLLSLHKEDTILVPLCGKTKDMLWLADQGFNVAGIELSSIACNDFFIEMHVVPEITKHSRFTKYKHGNIELFCGNLFDLTVGDFPSVQAVYDCKALIALPAETRKKYVHHIVSCLGTNISILLLTRETPCNVKPPPYSVDNKEVNLLYGKYFDVKQLKFLSVKDISERLIKKGYLEMRECAYLILENKL